MGQSLPDVISLLKVSSIRSPFLAKCWDGADAITRIQPRTTPAMAYGSFTSPPTHPSRHVVMASISNTSDGTSVLYNDFHVYNPLPADKTFRYLDLHPRGDQEVLQCSLAQPPSQMQVMKLYLTCKGLRSGITKSSAMCIG